MFKLNFIFLFYCQFLIAQTLDFYKEDITFTVTATSFYVDGIYYFHNNSDIAKRNLIFFPVNSTCQYYENDSVKIFDLLNMRPIKITKHSNNGFFFTLEVNAMDSAVYRIKYQQDICSDSVIYILKSTLKWDYPLTSATYKLLVPDTMDINYFSYLPDTTYEFEEFFVYLWERSHFLPDKDMIFKFKNK